MLAAGGGFAPDEEDPLYVKYSPERVLSLLLAAGANPRRVDREGDTALHGANSADIVRQLVAAGADVNARNLDGETPIFSSYADRETIAALIAAGADIHARDRYGRTALFAQRFEDGAAALLDAGLDVDATNGEGRTALERAVDPEMAAFLISRGASIPKNRERLSAFLEWSRHWDSLPAELAAAADAAGLQRPSTP